MPKRDLSGALARSLGTDSKAKSKEDRFSRAENYLETGPEKEAPIAPNAPAREKAPPRKKVIRDTFSFPEDDYGMIRKLQDKLIKQGHAATKSEVLRLGLMVADMLDDDVLTEGYLGLEKLKPGRPKGK